MKTPIAHLFVVLAALFVTPLLGVAHAKDKAENKEYASVVASALEEFDASNWVEARALFLRAHELYPNARTLRGAGIAAFQARLYVAAYIDLTAALESKVKSVTNAQRKEIEDVLARTITFIGRFRVDIQPPEAASAAEITVDGRAPLAKDGELWVEPGLRDVIVRAPGYEPANQRVDAEPGKQQQVSVTLRSQSAPVPATPQTLTASPTTPPAPVAEDTPYGVMPWVTAGAAVLFVGSAIAFHLASSGGVASVEDACRPNACALVELDSRIADAHIKTYDALAIASWSLAGVAAVTSVTLFALDGGDSGQADTAALKLRVAGPTVALHGRF